MHKWRNYYGVNVIEMDNINESRIEVNAQGNHIHMLSTKPIVGTSLSWTRKKKVGLKTITRLAICKIIS